MLNKQVMNTLPNEQFLRGLLVCPAKEFPDNPQSTFSHLCVINSDIFVLQPNFQKYEFCFK